VRVYPEWNRRKILSCLNHCPFSPLQRRLDAIRAVGSGVSICQVADCLGVTRQTVHNWMARSRHGNIPVCLADQARPGRPRPLDGEGVDFLQKALLEPPADWGYCSGDWTVSLLQGHLRHYLGLVVSTETVRRELHRLGYAWKRPRYVLQPDPLREKKSLVAKTLVFIA